MPAITELDLNELRSVEDLGAYQEEVRARVVELDADKRGLPLEETEKEEFAKWTATDKEITRRVEEFKARAAVVEGYTKKAEAIDGDADPVFRSAEAKGTTKERDIYDLSQIRMDFGRPDMMRSVLHERARRAIDIARFPLTESRSDQKAYGWSTENAKAHVEGLLEQDREDGVFARYLLATGSPTYRRAFTKLMNSAQRGLTFIPLSPEEQRALEGGMAAERALSLGTTGIPIPYQLDPTVIPVSNSVVNPWRAIARTEQIVVNEWRGVTGAAVTAAYAAEGTESSDNTPTLAQPSVLAVRAQAFIPFSIESDQDWSQLQASMARLITDAKDDLESNKFFSGSGTNEPFGLNAATSGIDTTTAVAATFAAVDLYAVEGALAPRFRARASMVANRAQLSRVRQFDTAGGAQLWLYIREAIQNAPASSGGRGVTGASLLGYPVFESSQMLSILTTGSRIALIGDFSYYLIVDRVGMSLEVIPHLFGAANRFPTGQRGLYAFWRNGGKIIDQVAFRFLKTS